jgi:hypothetical protein
MAAVATVTTVTGVRAVNLLPILRGELDVYRARLDAAPDALVFSTASGVRRRIHATAVVKANEQLTSEGIEPLPRHLTPQSLSRTFAALLFAIGETPPT